MANLKQALAGASQKLKNKKILTPALDAEILLGFVLKKPKEYLYTYPGKKLTEKQLAAFNRLISRRAKGEPVAYLRKLKEFFGLEFFVNKYVLIFRPETELLVEETINLLPPTAYRLPPKIADIGTGSGCIAIALKKHLPKIKIYAADISAKAILIAKKNAKKHKVKIQFYRGDLLAPLKNKKIDILIANLPYGDKKTWLKRKIPGVLSLKFEPKIALFAEKNGLFLYHKLFGQIARRKQRPKIILCEFDPRQTMAIKKLAKKYLPNYQIKIKKDLARLNRIILLTTN